MNEGVHTSPPGRLPERLIALGDIVGTHGVRGLLRFRPANEASAASVIDAAGQSVFVRPASSNVGRARGTKAGPDTESNTAAGSREPRAITLRSARRHGRMVLLEVESITDLEDAGKLTGLELAVPEAWLPPAAPDEYYTYQLEGLEVVTVTGEVLGTVLSVMPTGSNDVLTVRGAGREHLIPVIKDVIRKVDLEAGRVTIEPMEGLLD